MSTFFVKFILSRKKKSDVLLVPVDSDKEIKSLAKILKDAGWNVDIEKTPFPGKGINASDLP
jgi:hypothetical protein